MATDKSGNTTTEPSSGYREITLDKDVDCDYDYDNAGCLETVLDGVGGTDELYEYVYDDEHRLIEVIDDPDGDDDTIVEFTYDALGRRIKKEIYVGGSLDETVRFIYSGQDVVEEYLDVSGTWTLKAEYVHGIGIDNVLSLERHHDSEHEYRYWYHHDGLGSVTELTDSSGNLAQAYEYDAWGNATIYDPGATTPNPNPGVDPDTLIANPYMYTGRRWDPEIDLYYYRARYYDPAHGRFIQPDPARYSDGANLYSYARSCPMTLGDPTGAKAWSKLEVEMTMTAMLYPPAAMVGNVGKRMQIAFQVLFDALDGVQMQWCDADRKGLEGDAQAWFLDRDSYFDFFSETIRQIMIRPWMKGDGPEKVNGDQSQGVRMVYVRKKSGGWTQDLGLGIQLSAAKVLGTMDEASGKRIPLGNPGAKKEFLLNIVLDIFHESQHFARPDMAERWRKGLPALVHSSEETGDEYYTANPDDPLDAWFAEGRKKLTENINKVLRENPDYVRSFPSRVEELTDPAN